MRIGMFTDSYFPQVSGVSTSIKLLRDQLIAEGHEVYIFTTTDPNASIIEEGIIRLKSIPFASFDDRRIAIAGFDMCVKLAKQYQLDIIHTHTEFSLGIAGVYVASKLDIPVVHTYHTMYENYTHYIWNGRLIRRQHVRWYTRYFCSNVHGVITPSSMTHETLVRYGVKSLMRIIPTGVKIPDEISHGRENLREELGIPQDSFVLLSLCRLSKEKSVDEVIHNFAHLQVDHPDFYLIIVGDGPHRNILETLAKGYNLKHVLFVGEVPHTETNSYYQMADLYVSASDSESQGLTYLESLANRLPIIAKRNSYLSSIINESRYGYLYEEPETLAEGVTNFYNQLLSSEISEIKQADIDAISVKHFAESALEFYQELIDNYDGKKTPFFSLISGAAKDLLNIIQEV